MGIAQARFVLVTRLVVGCACLYSASSIALGQVTFNTVALNGEDAPGTGGAIPGQEKQFGVFFQPAIDANGGVGFRAILTGSGITSTNDVGYWSEATTGLDLVAREGNAAIPPGGLAGFATLADDPQFNGAGQAAFFATINGAGIPLSANEGVWSGDANGLSLAAREGDAAPGAVPPGDFDSFDSTPAINSSGQTVFSATVTNQGIWSHDAGILAPVVVAGDIAPGTLGANFGTFEAPLLNDSGQTAFEAFLFGGGITPSNDRGIWSGSAGSLSLVAREGDPAPGAGGSTFFQFNSLALNGAGSTAFSAFLAGPSGSGIWSQRAGGPLGAVMLLGDPAPGTPAGVTFNAFLDPVLNSAGQTAFKGFLAGPGVTSDNNDGIWMDTRGTLELVVREGDPAPGTGGAVFALDVSTPLLNNMGQLTFLAGLSGAGVNGGNDLGVWATGAGGEINLVVREGDVFDIDDHPVNTDFRTISFIQMLTGATGQDGRSTALNDAGQLALKLTFTDGTSGVFVASLPTPIPGDADGDGDVDLDDFNILASQFSQTLATGAAVGDFDADGDTDLDDFNILAANFGIGTEQVASLPEPGTLMLWAATVVGAVRRSRAN